MLVLGIPVLAIIVIALIFFQQQTKPAKTSEIVGYFQEGRVENYVLNYGTGAIEVDLKDVKNAEGKELHGKLAKRAKKELHTEKVKIRI